MTRTKPGTVEAWARADDNPVGGWYGLRKGYRGRFANYVVPILAEQGKVEFEKRGRGVWVRAITGRDHQWANADVADAAGHGRNAELKCK